MKPHHDTFAAIDIGSNAFRLLISYVEHTPGGKVEFRKAAFIRVPVRLGEDVFTSGAISPDKFHRVVDAMQGFAHLLRVFDVRAWAAYATSAMREASNGAALAAEIERTSGLKVEIISGREEAETIFEAGDIAGLMNGDHSYLFVDVGGGSVEVSVYSNRRRTFSESFPLGTVRALSGGVKAAEMERFKKCLRHIHKEWAPGAIIGSGGNINKAFKLLSKKSRGKEGNLLDTDDLRKLYDELARLSYDERIERFGLNDYRADVIVPALEIFLTVARECHINDIIVPKIGLVDGIIHRLYTRSDNRRMEEEV
jgi:exopolyphosphatase/guanosine-5'-triphosphate,3'-diphosphate pyrophosphatase